MISIEDLIQDCFMQSFERSHRYGFDFEPVTAYFKAYYTMSSVKRLIGTEFYESAMDTKMLRAYLGMREIEQEAMRKQLTPMQIKINEVFG